MRENNSTTLIGVIGTHRGAGVTHLVLLLGIFMSIVKGRRVACVEASNHPCFLQAERDVHKYFKRKAKIYAKGNYELSQIMNAYEYVIIDFGCNYENVRERFLMCRVKLVVGNLSYWKLKDVMDFIAQTDNEPSRRNWIFIFNNPVRHIVHKIKARYKLRMLGARYIPDIARLDEEAMDFLNELVEKQF